MTRDAASQPALSLRCGAVTRDANIVRAVASAVNNTVQDQAQQSAIVRLFAAEGKSRDGSDWCLSQRTSTIDYAEYIE